MEHMLMYKPYVCIIFLSLISLYSVSAKAIDYHQKEGCSPYSNYDEFITFLSDKNKFTPSLLFRWKFPRAQFDSFQKDVACHVIRYKVDGIRVTGYYLTPKVTTDEKLPLLVFNRGGNGSFGAINFVTLMEYLKPFVDRGYAVVASQYRGHTRKQPELYGKDEFGGRDVQDVHALIDIAKSKAEIDTSTIFLYGISRGGMMSYLVAKERDDIKAMAVHAGVTDLNTELTFRPEMENVYKALIPHYQDKKQEVLNERSVFFWDDQLPSDLPILLVHGTNDERVSVENSIKFYKKLKSKQRPVSLSLHEGEGHLFSDKIEQIEEVVAWFKALK